MQGEFGRRGRRARAAAGFATAALAIAAVPVVAQAAEVVIPHPAVQTVSPHVVNEPSASGGSNPSPAPPAEAPAPDSAPAPAPAPSSGPSSEDSGRIPTPSQPPRPVGDSGAPNPRDEVPRLPAPTDSRCRVGCQQIWFAYYSQVYATVVANEGGGGDLAAGLESELNEISNKVSSIVAAENIIRNALSALLPAICGQKKPDGNGVSLCQK